MRAKLLAALAPLVLVFGIAAAQPNVWHVVNGVLHGPGFVTTGPVLLPDGTASAPALAFASDTDNGFYRGGENLSAFGGHLQTLGNFTMAGTLTISADVALSRGAANRLDLATGDSLNLVGGGGSLQIGAVVAISSTAPTISSGFGTSPSIVASNGTAAFTINVGTGGTANSGVIGLPAATTGWAVQCMNTSTNTATVFLTKQTATTTTTATIGNYDAAGAAAAWVASNILVCSAIAY